MVEMSQKLENDMKGIREVLSSTEFSREDCGLEFLDFDVLGRSGLRMMLTLARLNLCCDFFGRVIVCIYMISSEEYSRPLTEVKPIPSPAYSSYLGKR